MIIYHLCNNILFLMMPQIFQVLRCYICEVFQVHQTKKSNKWECKMCGEKQSIKRHYGMGTGQECRLHVQKLNNVRGEIDNAHSNDSLDDEENYTESVNINKTTTIPITKSKWSDFVEESETDNTTADTVMYLDNKEVVFEIPKKRSRKNTSNNISSNSVSATTTELRNQNKKNYNLNINDIEEVNTQEYVKIDTNIKQNQLATEIKSINKFKPPVLNENSKWLQFINVTETPNDNNEAINILDTSRVEKCNPNSSQMFSLCEDDALDAILNI